MHQLIVDAQVDINLPITYHALKIFKEYKIECELFKIELSGYWFWDNILSPSSNYTNGYKKSFHQYRRVAIHWIYSEDLSAFFGGADSTASPNAHTQWPPSDVWGSCGARYWIQGWKLGRHVLYHPSIIFKIKKWVHGRVGVKMNLVLLIKQCSLLPYNDQASVQLCSCLWRLASCQLNTSPGESLFGLMLVLFSINGVFRRSYFTMDCL